MNTTESIGGSTIATAKRPDSFTTPFEGISRMHKFCLENGFNDPCMNEFRELANLVISIRDVKLFVYRCFGFEELFGDMKKRKAELVSARQIAMVLCYKLNRWSTRRIAEEIGGLEHATVYNALKAVSNHYDTEKDFRNMYNAIEKRFKNTFDL